MKDKFRLAVEWDKTIPERHKGAVIGRIHYEPGEGDVTILRWFDGLDAIERCDVLQDVIGLLQQEYLRAHFECFRKRETH